MERNVRLKLTTPAQWALGGNRNAYEGKSGSALHDGALRPSPCAGERAVPSTAFGSVCDLGGRLRFLLLQFAS